MLSASSGATSPPLVGLCSCSQAAQGQLWERGHKTRLWHQGHPHANSCFCNMTDVIFFCPQLAPTTVPPAQPCAHPCSQPHHPYTGVSLCGSPSLQHPQRIWDQPQLCGHQHSRSCLPVTVGHPHASFPSLASLPIRHSHHQHHGRAGSL